MKKGRYSVLAECLPFCFLLIYVICYLHELWVAEATSCRLGGSRYSVPEKFFTDEAYSDGVMRVNFLNWREKYW